MEYTDSLWAHLGGDAEVDVTTEAEVDQWLEKALDEAEDDNLDVDGVDGEPLSETTWNSAARRAILQRTATGEPDFIEAARRIIANKTYETVDGMLFDAFSASAVLQVYDALSEENKERMAALGLAKAVNISFKLMKSPAVTVSRRGSRRTAQDTVVPTWDSPASVGDAVTFEGSMWYVSNQDDTGKIAITPARPDGMPIDSQMGTGRWVMPTDVQVVIRRADHPMFSHARKQANGGLTCPDCGEPVEPTGSGWFRHVNGVGPGPCGIKMMDVALRPDGTFTDDDDMIDQGLADAGMYDFSNYSSRRRTAATEGDTSACRICGKGMQYFDHAWYGLKASSPQRDAPQHYCIAASPGRERAGEYNADGSLTPGSPGGQGGQYDAPAGTIYDNGANPIKVSRRKRATDDADLYDPVGNRATDGGGDDHDEDELYDDWAHDEESADREADQRYERDVQNYFKVPERELKWTESRRAAAADDELIDWEKRKQDEDEGLIDPGPLKRQRYQRELKTHIYSDSARTAMERGPVYSEDDARQTAIDWQHWVSEQNLSWGEMAEWSAYFEELAERFGLIDEFQENGII